MVAAMPIVSFGDPVSSSGSMDTSTTLPATPVAMTASGYITSISRITQEVSAAREVPPFTGIGPELCPKPWTDMSMNYGRISYVGEKEDLFTQGDTQWCIQGITSRTLTCAATSPISARKP